MGKPMAKKGFCHAWYKGSNWIKREMLDLYNLQCLCNPSIGWHSLGITEFRFFPLDIILSLLQPEKAEAAFPIKVGLLGCAHPCVRKKYSPSRVCKTVLGKKNCWEWQTYIPCVGWWSLVVQCTALPSGPWALGLPAGDQKNQSTT